MLVNGISKQFFDLNWGKMRYQSFFHGRMGGETALGELQWSVTARRVTAQLVPINFVFSLKTEMGQDERLWFSHPFSQRKLVIFEPS